MNEVIKNKILDLSQNGIITTKEITNNGIHRMYILELVRSGDIIPFSRGIYIKPDEIEDEYILLQTKYSRGVYSHGTALYLHGYSERVPLSFYMTFPYGYNTPSLNNENIICTRVVGKYYNLGIVNVKTPYGNVVKAYNLERSLCDMFRTSNEDLQTIQYAMKKYLLSKDKDVNKLIEYSKKLRVERKIRKYLEVLL